MPTEIQNSFIAIKTQAHKFAKRFEAVDGVRITKWGVRVNFIIDPHAENGVKVRVPLTVRGYSYAEACCFITESGETIYSLEHTPSVLTDTCDWESHPADSIDGLLKLLTAYSDERERFRKGEA